LSQVATILDGREEKGKKKGKGARPAVQEGGWRPWEEGKAEKGEYCPGQPDTDGARGYPGINTPRKGGQRRSENEHKTKRLGPWCR